MLPSASVSRASQRSLYPLPPTCVDQRIELPSAASFMMKPSALFETGSNPGAVPAASVTSVTPPRMTAPAASTAREMEFEPAISADQIRFAPSGESFTLNMLQDGLAEG